MSEFENVHASLNLDEGVVDLSIRYTRAVKTKGRVSLHSSSTLRDYQAVIIADLVNEQAKRIEDIEALEELIKLKFTSGNSIPVPQITIKRDEVAQYLGE